MCVTLGVGCTLSFCVAAGVAVGEVPVAGVGVHSVVALAGAEKQSKSWMATANEVFGFPCAIAPPQSPLKTC